MADLRRFLPYFKDLDTARGSIANNFDLMASWAGTDAAFYFCGPYFLKVKMKYFVGITLLYFLSSVVANAKELSFARGEQVYVLDEAPDLAEVLMIEGETFATLLTSELRRTTVSLSRLVKPSTKLNGMVVDGFDVQGIYYPRNKEKFDIPAVMILGVSYSGKLVTKIDGVVTEIDAQEDLYKSVALGKDNGRQCQLVLGIQGD